MAATTDLPGILDEVRNERRWQDERWGGPTHDDALLPAEWIGLIFKQCGKALSNFPERRDLYRRNLVEIAALATAAAESFDRQVQAESAQALADAEVAG